MYYKILKYVPRGLKIGRSYTFRENGKQATKRGNLWRK